MTKTRTTYFCQNCGSESAKWIGKCPTCSEWNTYKEEVIVKESKLEKKHSDISGSSGSKVASPQNINDVSLDSLVRLSSKNSELDRVLGGGIVPGSVILLGGEPGIGKSTLTLQIALNLGKKVLYISGEESAQQVKNRAERLGLNEDGFLIYTETATQRIFTHLKKLKPELIIVDSIQTVHTPYIDSLPGSISQIRESAGAFMRFAKESNTAIILIGHINKEGNIAGPKILEHIVDTVLQFEGDMQHNYRMLRSMKNRFGSTAELGIYEMTAQGLSQIENPSKMLISDNQDHLSGIAIASTIEGTRPFLIETQALVSKAVYGTPQRTANGVDAKRLNMLLAVLEKRCGFPLASQDIFVNIVGGLTIRDTGLDLALMAALMSSFLDESLSSTVTFAGEVGLSGEVRGLSKVELRIKEAEKLGFEKIILSQNNEKSIKSVKANIEVELIKSVKDLYQTLFN